MEGKLARCHTDRSAVSDLVHQQSQRTINVPFAVHRQSQHTVTAPFAVHRQSQQSVTVPFAVHRQSEHTVTVPFAVHQQSQHTNIVIFDVQVNTKIYHFSTLTSQLNCSELCKKGGNILKRNFTSVTLVIIWVWCLMLVICVYLWNRSKQILYLRYKII